LLLDIYDHLPIFHVYDHTIVDSEILHTINESNINDSNINNFNHTLWDDNRDSLYAKGDVDECCDMFHDKFTDLYTFVCLVL